MLYVTTRCDKEVYTVNHTLIRDLAPDGGCFVPFRTPKFSPEDISALNAFSFGQRMADILNLLFGTRLTAWDVEFSVGRYPVRTVPMSHRVAIAECWHNPEWDLDWLVRKLVSLVKADQEPSQWAGIGVRIGVLFGIYDGVCRDIAVSGRDMLWCLACLYAKSFGLPMGRVVICSRERDRIWDLLHKGELRSEAGPMAERLIHGCGGPEEVKRCLEALESEKLYRCGDVCLSIMERQMFVSMVGRERVRDAIPNVLRTSGYLLGPDTALCYSGLQDYRAVAGESRAAFVLSAESPLKDIEYTSATLGISEEELRRRVNKL